MSEFFTRLHLEAQVGCSPSALRSLMQALEATLLETAEAWEKDACTGDEVREIIGAVDETFLERLMLVFMDLPTGYLLLEEVAEDRTFTTWKALVEERLKALGAGVRYLVSDRAKALIQLADQGFECLSMPDFFHCMHDLVKSYSLAIARGVRHAHQELTESRGGAKDAVGCGWAASGRLRGPAWRGGPARGRAALGEGAQHVSPPPGNPLAHAASFQH